MANNQPKPQSGAQAGPTDGEMLRLRIERSVDLSRLSPDTEAREAWAEVNRRANASAELTLRLDAQSRSLEEVAQQAQNQLARAQEEARQTKIQLDRSRTQNRAWQWGVGAFAGGGLLAAILVRRSELKSAERRRTDAAALDSAFESVPDPMDLADQSGGAEFASDFPLSRSKLLGVDALPSMPPNFESELSYDETRVESTRAPMTSTHGGIETSAAAFTMSEQNAHGPIEVPDRAHLADLRWVAQPLKDLVALNRALREWHTLDQLGVAEQALMQHLEHWQDTSAWVYVELLCIYCITEQEAEFHALSDRFRAKFNRLAPTWEELATSGKELSRYDLAMSQLTQAWAEGRALWLMEQWLIGESFMRRLMDLAAFRDVFFLFELCLCAEELESESATLAPSQK